MLAPARFHPRPLNPCLFNVTVDDDMQMGHPGALLKFHHGDKLRGFIKAFFHCRSKTRPTDFDVLHRTYFRAPGIDAGQFGV